MSKVPAPRSHAQTLFPHCPQVPPHPQPGASPVALLSITVCIHANSKGNGGFLLEKKPQAVPLDQGAGPSARVNPSSRRVDLPSHHQIALLVPASPFPRAHWLLFPNSNRNLQDL